MLTNEAKGYIAHKLALTLSYCLYHKLLITAITANRTSDNNSTNTTVRRVQVPILDFKIQVTSPDPSLLPVADQLNRRLSVQDWGQADDRKFEP